MTDSELRAMLRAEIAYVRDDVRELRKDVKELNEKLTDVKVDAVRRGGLLGAFAGLATAVVGGLINFKA